MKISKRITALLLAVLMVALCGCGATETAPAASGEPQPAAAEPAAAADGKQVLGNGDTYFFTIMAPPATSPMYSFWVGLAEGLQNTFTNVMPTVSESQGAVAQAKGVRVGDSNIANCASATDYENYNGLGVFDGDPNHDLRILFYYDIAYAIICVDASKGIKDISDLAGQKFNPGGTGTTVEQITRGIFKTFNIEPNYFDASQSDAADAYANKEIIGTVKLGNATDSYIVQLNLSSPIDIVGLTEEQAAAVKKEMPYLASGVIPAGSFTGVDHDSLVLGNTPGCQILKDTFTQQEQYQLVKAVIEDTASYWGSSYPAAAQNDLCELTLQSSVPLAPGTVQYLVEKGYTVPESIIPPEYVPAA